MSDAPKPDGGPAFPCNWMDFQPETGMQVVREQFGGMSLRDWFAGKAMAALILAHSPQIETQHSGTHYLQSFNGSENAFDSWVAKRSNEIADAMLSERSK